MRKIILLVAALLLWQISDARPISEEQARRNAADFFATVSPRSKAVASGDLRLVRTFPEAATKSTDSPLIYVFESPAGGYVVAAGDDAARAILGYSADSKFPSASAMPDNMREMFQWYEDIIAFARQKGWSSVATKAYDLDPKNSVVLETAHWDQWSPFNDLAPDVRGGRPPIGCVATAIAIVMRYHQCPVKGTGTLPGYYSGKTFIDSIKLGHTYNWYQMPEKSSGFTATESQQIARLLYDVAVMCQMQFDLEGSSASIASASLMPQYFGYDRSMSFYYRDNFTDERWEQMLKDEIDAERPVLYAGFEDEGGHAFVIDGYNGRYFSINYGWSGGSTFYTITPIEGRKSDLFDFTDSQQAVFNLKPDQGGEPVPQYYIFSGGPSAMYNMEKNKPFVLDFAYVGIDTFVPTDYTYTKTFSYVLYDSKGAFRERISPEVTLEMKIKEYTDIGEAECMYTCDLAKGDRISLSVKDPDTGEWSPVSEDNFDNIIFTDRPLKDLVKVIYDGKRPKNAEKAYNGDELYLCLESQKAVSWVIYGEGSDEPLIWSCFWDFYTEEATEVIVASKNGGDPLNDSYIWLPEGKYLVVFRNALTGEELKLHLEL